MFYRTNIFHVPIEEVFLYHMLSILYSGFIVQKEIGCVLNDIS